MSESTPGAIGTRTAASHAAMVAGDSPGPSAPTTRATGSSSSPLVAAVSTATAVSMGVSATLRKPVVPHGREQVGGGGAPGEWQT